MLRWLSWTFFFSSVLLALITSHFRIRTVITQYRLGEESSKQAALQTRKGILVAAVERLKDKHQLLNMADYGSKTRTQPAP